MKAQTIRGYKIDLLRSSKRSFSFDYGYGGYGYGDDNGDGYGDANGHGDGKSGIVENDVREIDPLISLSLKVLA